MSGLIFFFLPNGALKKCRFFFFFFFFFFSLLGHVHILPYPLGLFFFQLQLTNLKTSAFPLETLFRNKKD